MGAKAEKVTARALGRVLARHATAGSALEYPELLARKLGLAGIHACGRWPLVPDRTLATETTGPKPGWPTWKARVMILSGRPVTPSTSISAGGPPWNR